MSGRYLDCAALDRLLPLTILSVEWEPAIDGGSHSCARWHAPDFSRVRGL